MRSQMKRLELKAIGPKRFVPQTTDSRHGVWASPNLLLDEKNAPGQPRVGPLEDAKRAAGVELPEQINDG